MTSLPGWSTKIDEVSNGVFNVVLTDQFGRKAEVTDNATNETIEKAINNAFEIERQVSRNWNKFLYDLCLLNIPHEEVILAEYNDQAFGSWVLELENKRIVFDGKDFELILQAKADQDWKDLIIIEKSNLTYLKISELIEAMTKKHNT
ncbi:MAG TPA: hypothetical protein VNI52_02795 [Sphingobacteriaceae bacterium]|nr:hypothetical protein [Sphingobacteriaceae bacterium]